MGENMKMQQRKSQALCVAFTTSVFAACSAEPNPAHSPQTQLPSNPESSENNASDDSKSKPSDASPLPPKQICTTSSIKAGSTLNIQYQATAGVEKNLQSLDVYMPEVKDPCTGIPVVVWVHGGAWMIGDKSQVGFKAKHFNSLGYGFVSINYRLSPNLLADVELSPNRIKFPDHPSDVGAALGWIHKNILKYGGNPYKIALLGHSAGAHLAALVALDQSYITKSHPSWNPESLRCVGSYDTEAYNVTTAVASASGQQLALYRNAFGFDPSQLTKASPLSHVKELNLPFQLALRGDSQRRATLQEFKSALEGQKNNTDVINAESLSHEEVNRVIGSPDDQIMTPAVTKFVRSTCFGQ